MEIYLNSLEDYFKCGRNNLCVHPLWYEIFKSSHILQLKKKLL